MSCFILQGYPEKLLHRQIPVEEEDIEDAIELNHTHCILFDNGQLNERLSDFHRNRLLTTAYNDMGPTCTYYCRTCREEVIYDTFIFFRKAMQ